MSKNTDAKQQSQAREKDFKGKPVLALYRNEGDKYPLQFGLAKAGLILAHVEDIRAFQAKHQRQEAPTTA